MKKKLTIKIDTTYKYLQLWNGLFHLTNKEMEILAAFMDLKAKGPNLCSVPNKKRVAKIVGIEDYNTLNNYVKRFKDKGAIKKSGVSYTMNAFLNPKVTHVELHINRSNSGNQV
tara:strand:+ start:22661 stop:23002 length:342 start_codon:yes stop_codon:yes gene_type:complete